MRYLEIDKFIDTERGIEATRAERWENEGVTD
jgi:hypothetical protein